TQLWRVLVDNGSAMDILCFDAFKKIGLNESDLKPTATPLYGFTGDSLMPMGMIELMDSVGTYPRVSTIMTQFLVVDCPSAFNAVLGRPTLRELRAVTSIYHLTMKFPTQHGVGEVRENQYDARTCYNNSLKLAAKDATSRTMMVHLPEKASVEAAGKASVEAMSKASVEAVSNASVVAAGKAPVGSADKASVEPSVKASIKTTSEDFDPREIDEEVRTGPIEDLEDLSFDLSSRTLKIGTEVQGPVRASLITFLKSNLDVFAWQHSDMVGIDSRIISHHLNIDLTKKPVRQKRRAMNPERYVALKEEVEKLLEIGFIRESFYPDWLANPVLVKKPNGKWRTCIDFTDLNKACPKDSFPLLRIDQLVDATSGHELLSFMDAYS
ncbi:hypothetical protein PanWU01x14_207720, partial [Parasponia andersonii]